MTRKTEYTDAKLEKIVLVGRYDSGYRIVPLSIFCRVVIDAKGELSITGVESPFASGDCGGSCGQIDMSFAHRNPQDNDARTTNPIAADAITYAAGWDADKWLTLLDIWKAHHLNLWNRNSGNKTAHPLPQDVIDFLTALPKPSRQPVWI